MEIHLQENVRVKCKKLNINIKLVYQLNRYNREFYSV